MGDDIDDLLDEVESKFCVKKNGSKQSLYSSNKTKSGQKTPLQTKNTERFKNKLDDDINDLLDLDIPEPTKANPSNSSSYKSNSSSHGVTKKCFPIFVGGTSYDTGFGSSLNKRICDSLRCTSCDFRVSMFPDFEWNPKTDYLFLRNNAPDFQKLKKNLRNKKGTNAYSCQCSWRNFTDITELKESSLKWVCGKH